MNKEQNPINMGNIKFLLIDDDSDLVEVMNFLIHNNIVSNSKLAYNGLDGHDIAMKEEFDFIITDYQLPTLNGIDFIKSLRKTPGLNQNTPIILISGFQPELSGDEKTWSDVFILDKPLTIKQLMYTIKCCMNLKKHQCVDT